MGELTWSSSTTWTTLHDLRMTRLETWIHFAYVTSFASRISAHTLPAQSRSALSVNHANSNANTHMQHWQGTCIHDVEPPRWVQKRRMVRPDEPQYDYDEPQTATAVAINTKFSVYAVGLQS